MATKHDSSCLQKAGDDEPIFVLRAQDACAPATVAMWIAFARRAGAPKAKIDEANALRDQMIAWQEQNGAKTPD